VLRPYVDPDYSPTEGMTDDETTRLIETARDWAPRSYALVMLLYLTGARVDELLSLNADQLGYDRGHRTLPLGRRAARSGPRPCRRSPSTRSSPTSATAATRPCSSPSPDAAGPSPKCGSTSASSPVTQASRRPPASSPTPCGTSSSPTTSPTTNTKLQDVQDAVSHSDPRTTQRYNRRRGLLDNHPAYSLAAKLGQRLRQGEKETE
jgi:integrase/recombinase XerD